MFTHLPIFFSQRSIIFPRFVVVCFGIFHLCIYEHSAYSPRNQSLRFQIMKYELMLQMSLGCCPCTYYLLSWLWLVYFWSDFLMHCSFLFLFDVEQKQRKKCPFIEQYTQFIFFLALLAPDDSIFLFHETGEKIGFFFFFSSVNDIYTFNFRTNVILYYSISLQRATIMI